MRKSKCCSVGVSWEGSVTNAEDGCGTNGGENPIVCLAKECMNMQIEHVWLRG